MTKQPKPEWRNRIVESAEILASEIMANPRNARKHPASQRAALKGVLNEVGWVGRVIVNKTSGLLVDGHLRVDEAAQRGETIPVDFVELTDAEEAMILALFDPIGALAQTDTVALSSLLDSIETTDSGVLALIDSLAGEKGLGGFGDPDGVGNDEASGNEFQEKANITIGDLTLVAKGTDVLDWLVALRSEHDFDDDAVAKELSDRLGLEVKTR